MKDKIKTNLVIGLGEVGNAIREVLECDGHDPYKKIIAPKRNYDAIHIAIPYEKDKYDFEEEVLKYQRYFKPEITIIHSSVPIGVSRFLDAVHSPIRGVHPSLALGIKTFVKFFGGEKSKEAGEIFSEKGVKVYCTENQEDTEAGKLWDTTQYGVMILLNKEIKRYCDEHSLNFEVVYKMFNMTYAEGYRALGREEVARPYLKYMPGPIGGHCVVPNAKLFDSESTQKILSENSQLELEDLERKEKAPSRSGKRANSLFPRPA